MKKLLLLLIIFSITSCKTKVNTATPSAKKTGLIAEKAMVVSARKEASDIGLAVLKKGGNAFDAMIATEMALAVVYPYAGNLGGGGFMVYRKADGQTGTLDYREKAPLLSTKDMYQDENGEVISHLSKVGGMAVGVPGTVAGIFAVHEKFGSMPMAEILEPVIALARNGYVVTANQEASLGRYRENFVRVNRDSIFYSKNFAEGDTIRNLALARTLERIAENGRDEFYNGPTGEKIIAYLQRHGGIMSLQDLREYQSFWRDPIHVKYNNLNVISMAPPSSGGIVLGQILKMIEGFPLEKYGHNSVEMIQVMTEAERRAYADRSFYLGDPDFVDIPVEVLLSDKYLNGRMDNFSFSKATPSSEMEHGAITAKESMETTHYSIVDQFGNAVAATTTLNGAYGSKLYVEELGFFLNNEMDDFSAKPGVPNMFGLIGAEANSIAPGKKMLSSMTPTIVEKKGKLWLVLGSPGGSTIITSVLQTILNVEEYNMSMQEAVDAPRFHHQWLPDEILFEPNAFAPDVLNTLRIKGYHINEGESTIIGKVDAIRVLPDGKLEGGADRRGDDTAAGF
ncbi:gamma-glutamyltransferase [Zunongwangia sp. F363]|uniref:Glutathione hydrolase proenzyme n=1 Tax=Autumnicola tepida TaxID=3075595 RepID=A0ABU3CED5_9FLAO|nr:gamma-glutamyltransferase [Zunongwangia sp. F363]MDT0644700.1 gamma-glutamyltransferase [Zunongwangia sp. F363]